MWITGEIQMFVRLINLNLKVSKKGDATVYNRKNKSSGIDNILNYIHWACVEIDDICNFITFIKYISLTFSVKDF